TLSQYHYPLKSREEVRCYLGHGVAWLVRKALPETIGEDIYQQCLIFFKEYYQRHLLIETKAYDGIESLLDELKRQQIPMAIVSNKIQSGVDGLRDQFFGKWIDVAIGNRPGLALKPAPDSVHLALSELGLKPSSDIVYVGDSETDVLTAKNALLPFIGVTWGFRTAEQLWKAQAELLIDEPKQLLSLIKKRVSTSS
ncbi:MAG TPA: HAD family hydrolase, partial [Bacilli bacterium]|nr:HAD family hydrolase [Bacilli bacterium]